jgi:hypothetical protein
MTSRKPRMPEKQDYDAAGGYMPKNATDKECAERYRLAVAAMLIRLYTPQREEPKLKKARGALRRAINSGRMAPPPGYAGPDAE